MSADARPSLLNIRSMPVNTALQFTTDVTDAVVFNQDFCRIEMARKGFLHPNSQLVLSVKQPAADPRAFPFVNVGLFSLIQRAVLKTSTGRVLCETDDLNHLMACESMFISNTANKEREQFKTGRQVAYEQVYVRSDDGAGNVNLDSRVEASGYGLCNGKEYDEDVGASQGLSVKKHLLTSSLSTYALSLHELFPYLKSGNQLPLYMMPTVQIELFFRPASDLARMCDPAEGGLTYEINSPQLFADYLFYSGEFMADYQQKNNNMTFSYIDYRLSKNSQTVGQAANSVRNLGGNGMQVTKVLTSFQGKPTTIESSLMGDYNAIAPTKNGDQRRDFTSNLFMNSKFLFPQKVTNSATHFHHLISAQGVPAFVSRDTYCGEGGGLDSSIYGEFEGVKLSDGVDGAAGSFAKGMAGLSFWQGFRNNTGERVDSRGIELHNEIVTAASVTQRAWLEILRYATLVDGELEVYYV